MEKEKPLSPIWENILVDAIDNKGRYDASKLAELLDWTKREIAQYLDKDPSAISRFSASPVYQQSLSELAAVFNRLLKLVNNDLQVARAWLRTPIRVLEGVSPKEKILQHDLKTVGTLIEEVEAGFSV